ncbi:hypothetical protein QYE76_028721 [Lolium multiflorum]|uniref:TF-B3 domain-containing protein n=1 Tax=Lolium multiflorum TaxID=4521 RepID=A0AAD8QLH1_LOLMU|nr:hypothetical protein QYE76_028721 [Lolium multiflorum]
MNGSPPPSTGSCLAVTAADTDEHRRYFLNSADLIHRILQQLDGRPVSSIQIVTREGSTSTSVSYPLAASVPSLAVLSSSGSTIWLGTDFPGGGTSFSRLRRPQPPRHGLLRWRHHQKWLEFKQCLKGILPRPIKLKTSVGCAWYVHIDEYQGELVLKDGWFGFAEAHELQLDDLLVFECSNKKLKLGESLSWKETSVEPAPVCKVFRRIDEENTADSFCKVLCTSELEVITIPTRVLPWFYGGCPESINLKMSTACTWIVDLKQQDVNVLMDAGWPEFVKAHDLKVGYLLTFKKLDTKSLQVLIFGYNCCEKVIWCSGYHPSLGQQNESQLY